jgi:hypothetical protein
MKGIGKVIVLILGLSFFFVLYVRGQIALLHVSYQIEAKNDKVIELSEEYRRLRFEVEQLKAPRLLEEKMKNMKMDLTLPQEIRVVKVRETSLPSLPLQQVMTQQPTVSTRFANLMGRFVEVAQAKTDN